MGIKEILKYNSIWTLTDLIVEFNEEFNKDKNNAYEEIPSIKHNEIEKIMEKILEKHNIIKLVEIKKREKM